MGIRPYMLFDIQINRVNTLKSLNFTAALVKGLFVYRLVWRNRDGCNFRFCVKGTGICKLYLRFKRWDTKMNNDCNFQNHVIDAVKKAVGLMSIDTPENNVNAHVQLNLKLELECGLDGDWVISQAELQKPEPTQFHLKHTKPETQLVMPSGSTSRPIKASQRRIRKFRL